jgi:hypothetical protein
MGDDLYERFADLNFDNSQVKFWISKASNQATTIGILIGQSQTPPPHINRLDWGAAFGLGKRSCDF